MSDNIQIIKECKVGDKILASTMKTTYLHPSCFKTPPEVRGESIKYSKHDISTYFQLLALKNI